MSGSIRHGFPTPLKIPYATIPDRSLLRANQVKPTIVVARHHQRGTPRIPGEIRKWKPGEDNGPKREHLACAFNQIRIIVKIRLIGKPILSSASLGYHCHREFPVIEKFDNDMDFRIRGNAATLKFGRKLPGRDINDDLLHDMLLLLGPM
jgi:hypothetical protein